MLDTKGEKCFTAVLLRLGVMTTGATAEHLRVKSRGRNASDKQEEHARRERGESCEAQTSGCTRLRL